MRRAGRLAAACVVALSAAGAFGPAAFAQTDLVPPPTTLPVGAPTTAPSIPPTVTPPPDGGGAGFFDVGGRIKEAINEWLRDLVKGAAQPVLDLVGALLFTTPDFTGDGRVRDLWFVSWGVASSVFALLMLAAAFVGMSYETVQSRYAVKDLLPRLALGFVAANLSLLIAGKAIELANALSGAFVAEGVGFDGGASLLKVAITSAAIDTSGPFAALVALFVVVVGLGLVAVAVCRLCTIVVLVAAAPLCLIGYALPQTEGAARLWWRALVGCLGVQVAQAFVFTTALRVFFAGPRGGLLHLPDSGFVDLLVVGCLFWLLLRIPSYARRLVFQPRNSLGLLVKQQAMSRAVRAATTAAKAAMA